MKPLFPYFLTILGILISCSSTREHVPDLLSEQEQYELISTAYVEYLDSAKKEKELYFKFAVMEDTMLMNCMLYGLENKQDKICEILGSESEGPILFENSIDRSKLNSFIFLDDSDLDSAKRIDAKEGFIYGKPKYAISRPYKPDTCNYALIQVFEVPFPTGCLQQRNRVVVFQRSSSSWKLEGYY